MSENSINRDSRLKIGTWITIGSPLVSELASSLGFDWMLFDAEHGNIGRWNLLENLVAANASGKAETIVRVSSLEPNKISFALDNGASGVMVPHVSSVKDAELAAASMRYAPLGRRSFTGSSRSFMYGTKKVPAEDLSKIAPKLFVQIEDCNALENVESIAKVDGVDVVFLGPYDMGLELSGKKNKFGRTLDEARRMVALAAKNAGKLSGTLMCKPELMKPLLDIGFTYISASSDMGALRGGYLSSIKNATAEL